MFSLKSPYFTSLSSLKLYFLLMFFLLAVFISLYIVKSSFSSAMLKEQILFTEKQSLINDVSRFRQEKEQRDSGKNISSLEKQAQFLDLLLKKSAVSRLNVLSLKPGSAADFSFNNILYPGLQISPVDIKLKGPFPAVYKFLLELENNPDLLLHNGITLEKINNDEIELTASLELPFISEKDKK